MNLRTRSIYLGLGIFVAISGIFNWYKSNRKSVSTAEPYVRSTKVSDIEPGTYRYRTNIYTSAVEKNYTHTLLFLRKNDGSVRGFYLPLRDRVPAVPADDGITPVDLCTPFQISAEPEQIECVVEDIQNKLRIVHHWSWDGKAIGPLTPHLREIEGSEKNGEFVFADPWQPERTK